MDQFSWVMPLLLMPGVGLLITSTSARFSQVHEELHHLLDHNHTFREMLATNLHQRAVLFRNALMALYLSIALFALGSVAGAVVDMLAPVGDVAVTVTFSFAGMLCLMAASVLLVRESLLSLDVFEEHFEMLKEDEKNDH